MTRVGMDRPAAKLIDNAAFLEVVRRFTDGEVPDKTISWPMQPTWLPQVISGPRWALIWDMEEAFPGIPDKVLRAKAAKLIKRGLLDGCACGCRGDFEITDAGRSFLKENAVLATSPDPEGPSDAVDR